MKKVLFFALIIMGSLNLTGCKELGIKQLMKQGASPAEILMDFCRAGDARGIQALFDMELLELPLKPEMIREIIRINPEESLIKALPPIIDNGFNITRLGETGFSALHQCILYKDTTVLADFLLHQGCDVNEASEIGATALHIAAASGKSELVELLLEKGADPYVLNRLGYSPLDIAEKETADLLPEDSRNQEIRFDSELDFARSFDFGYWKPESLQGFLQEQLEDAAMREDLQMVRHILDRYEIDPAHTEDWQQDGPLYEAARYGNIPIISLLLSAGFDPEYAAPFWEGTESALKAAVDNGRDEAACFLIDAGASLDIIDSDEDYGWYSGGGKSSPMPFDHTRNILDIAVLGGCTRTVKKLVQMGYNPLKRSTLNETLLFYAGNSDIAEFLIDRGVRVNHESKESRTALHRAVYSGHFDVAMVLIDEGADVNDKDMWGATPLHNCASNHETEVRYTQKQRNENPLYQNFVNQAAKAGIKVLGIDESYKGREGATSQMMALLLVNGADPWLKNNDGHTPLDMARYYGNREAVMMLE